MEKKGIKYVPDSSSGIYAIHFVNNNKNIFDLEYGIWSITAAKGHFYIKLKDWK